MKTRPAQSATSLPRAPRDDAQERMRKYFLMMSVRVICFILMVAVTPYGWYTWVFAIGAAVLPYLAVVVANVSRSPQEQDAVAPARAVTEAEPRPAPEHIDVIRIEETSGQDEE